MWISRYIGRTTRKKDKYAIIILIFVIILKINAFNYINWNPTYGGWINNLLSLGLFFYWLFYIRSSSQMNFRKEVYLMMFLPFLSIFNSWSIYGQSPTSGAWILIGNFTWIIYFILHTYKISESTLLKVFFIISLAIVIIQIVQQFTYPKAFFGVITIEEMIEKGIDEVAEMRNGLWRFRVSYNAYFTAPILFASWIWLQKKFNMNLLLWVILLLISVYLTLTRQVMFACIITLIYSFFLSKKGKLRALIFILIFIACLYSFYDILFSSLAEQTAEDSNEDNIRLLSAAYYWNESLKTPFTFLFGIGKGAANSSLGYIQKMMSSLYGFYVNDIGFIGGIYERGCMYVIVCYFTLYKIFIRFKNTIPLYIRLFVLFAALMSIMIFPFINDMETLVWTILLYVSDIHINQNNRIVNYE